MQFLLILLLRQSCAKALCVKAFILLKGDCYIVDKLRSRSFQLCGRRLMKNNDLRFSVPKSGQLFLDDHLQKKMG